MSLNQRTLVAQIRVVMQSLTVPTRRVLAVMEEVEHLAVTHMQLPVVEFSPFSALSASPAASRDDTDERQSRRATASESFAQTAKRQETPAAVSDTENRPTPVFSLRTRTEAQTHKAELVLTQSQSRGQPATENSHESSRYREENTKDPDVEETEKQRNCREVSPPEKSLLRVLTEQSSPTMRNDDISWLELTTQALNIIDNTSASQGSIPPNLEARQSGENEREMPTTHETNSDTSHRNGTVKGEALLSPFAQRDTQMDDLTSSLISHTRIMTQQVPTVRSASVSIPADRGNDAPPSQLVSPLASLGHIALDAEEIASLVNDILVEQARRNGVDLS